MVILTALRAVVAAARITALLVHLAWCRMAALAATIMVERGAALAAPTVPKTVRMALTVAEVVVHIIHPQPAHVRVAMVALVRNGMQRTVLAAVAVV